MKFFIQFFLCGILTSFLFPPFFLTPLGFIIFPYLFYLLNHKEYLSFKYYTHFISGFIYGLGFFYIYLGWIKEPFLIDSLTKNYSIFSYLLVFYCSLYFGFIFLFIKYFNKINLKYFALPALIILSEFFCANFAYGFPWFSFSLINSGNNLGTSIIYYFGTYGLSYISILIFLFPSIFIFKEIKFKKIITIIYFIIFIIFIFLIIFRSKVLVNSENQTLSISLVQLNFSNHIGMDKNELIIKQKDILKTIKENNSELIIFAENNFPFQMQIRDIDFLQEVIKVNKNIIIGSTRKENDKFYNSFFLINKKIYKKFDKQILVPFGEFIPLRGIFNFMKYIAGSEDFSSGKDKRQIILNDKIKILPIICYEIIYFWRLLNKENFDSNIMVNLTNDSWFGKFSGPYQHFYFSKLRAAEFNKPLIRVSNNGVSAVIDNYGNVVDFIELNKKETKNIKISISNFTNNHLHKHKFTLILIFLSLLFQILINNKNDYR